MIKPFHKINDLILFNLAFDSIAYSMLLNKVQILAGTER